LKGENMKLRTILNFVISIAVLAPFILAFNFSSRPAKADQAVAAAQLSQEAKWIKLFADESWYKTQAGKEQVFSGKLEAIKVNPNMATTLMRTSYYRLGKRTIYTGAKKVEALDSLAGKNVEIRGKAYDINLEGQAVSEIWPAEIRQVEAP
jgi:hypothetical protein